MKLFTCVWDSRSISQDWKDVLLIPLPRKEDLSLSDNWHGINLIQVVGKVLAKIIQRRMQVVCCS